jgi:hypothetical protein
VLATLAASVGAQTKVNFTCGTFTTEMWRTGATSHWTIASGSEKNTENAVLKKGPRFSCVAGNVLAIEFVAASGQSFLDLHFPDSTNIGYGGQTLERNGRYVLPIQARKRIPEAFRSAFDYHCRLEMPADPIPADVRKDCVL